MAAAQQAAFPGAGRAARPGVADKIAASRLPMKRRTVLASLLLPALPPVARADAATTIVVGPDPASPRLADALRAAADGDTVVLLPGTYRGEVAVLTQKRLTVRGIGATPPLLLADGRIAEGKAMLVVRDGDVEIENLEFRGARAADGNGAGIRFERGRLRLRRCRFIDNENGVLAANFDDSRLAIEDCEFAAAPHREGALHHLLYVGRIAQLSLRGSRFHRGFEGHLIKSRAHANRIEYNLIYDGPGGQASYEIDLPEGGIAHLVGNVVGQSDGTQNPVLIAFGAEARGDRRSRLYLVHNTLVNDKLPAAWFLRVWADKLGPDLQVHAYNNLLIGPGVFEWGAPGRFGGSCRGVRASLRDADLLDFRLERWWLGGDIVDALDADGLPLKPTAEFALPVGTRPLPPGTPLRPGALQL